MKICPIRPRNAGVVECQEENCALWCEEQGACAFKTSAICAFTTFGTLNSINRSIKEYTKTGAHRESNDDAYRRGFAAGRKSAGAPD